jgi:hypothetical protein
MKGRYCDSIFTAANLPVFAGSWRSNTIVDSAWRLICGLLVNQPGLTGIRYLAVGAGEESWDGNPQTGADRTVSLANESARIAILPGDIEYLDHNGVATKMPTPWIEINVKASWPDRSMQLREFGLVGGDATGQAGSGLLINYVVHPLMTLAPGDTLTRRIRLHLRPSGQRTMLEMSDGKLSQTQIERIDGVAKQSAAALRKAGVNTIGTLARMELSAQSIGISPIKMAEWRARARLSLAIMTELFAPPQVHGINIEKFLVEGIQGIADQTGLSTEIIAPLYEQLCRLQSCLDDSFLDKLTVGDLLEMS